VRTTRGKEALSFHHTRTRENEMMTEYIAKETQSGFAIKRSSDGWYAEFLDSAERDEYLRDLTDGTIGESSLDWYDPTPCD
jgi:hypothetical protein